MTTINVQFADEARNEIVSYFGSPQDPTVYANLGTVTADDPRWKTFYDLFPPLARDGMPAPTA